MRRAALLMGVLLTATAVVGCGVGKLLKRADEAMVAGRADEAVRYYEQALGKKRDLAEEPEFAARLGRARVLAAHQAGQALAAQGQWESAIPRYEEVLALDPTFADARRALDEAKVQAARARHRQALDLADGGDVSQAVAALRRALELDPANRDAHEALDSVTPGREDRGGRAWTLYEEALGLARERRWPQAAEALESALAAGPNHLPARAERVRCRQAIAQANQAYADGSRLYQERRLDDARAALGRALEVWPTFREAGDLLSRADGERREAEQRYGEAAALAGEGRWDEAIRSAEAALGVYPFHAGAKAQAADARRRAAMAHVEAGDRLLAEGRLAEAEDRFARALGYMADLPAARAGLGRADFLRGQADERRGLWGNALLAYLDAAEHTGGRDYAPHVQAAEGAIQARLGFALAVTTPQTDPAVGLMSAVRARVLADLASRSPEFLRLADVGAGAEAPAYTVNLRLAGLDIRPHLARTETRLHTYAVAQEVPNPEVGRLHHLLMVARQECERVRAEAGRPCPACRGTARLTCDGCRGAGVHPCAACGRTGRVACGACGGAGQAGGGLCGACGGTGRTLCQPCHGDGIVNCPVCSTPGERRGFFVCTQCRGSGRAGRTTAHDVERREREVQRLQFALAHTPPTVIRQGRAEWPYLVDFYEKVGRLAVAVEVRRGGAGVVCGDTVRTGVRYEDAAVRNPNPAAGLAEDGLLLPADGEVQRALAEAAGTEAAAKVIEAVVADRSAWLRAVRDQARREERQAEALEAGVDLALFLRAYDAAESARLLQALRAERRAARPGAPPAAAPPAL